MRTRGLDILFLTGARIRGEGGRSDKVLGYISHLEGREEQEEKKGTLHSMIGSQVHETKKHFLKAKTVRLGM